MNNNQGNLQAYSVQQPLAQQSKMIDAPADAPSHLITVTNAYNAHGKSTNNTINRSSDNEKGKLLGRHTKLTSAESHSVRPPALWSSSQNDSELLAFSPNHEGSGHQQVLSQQTVHAEAKSSRTGAQKDNKFILQQD